mgnify:CR=1 FL=1
MFEEINPERYRITGRVQGTDDNPHFTFESEVYAIFIPEDLEMVKADAKQFQEFFGLSKWEIQVYKTRDKWEAVRFDD